MINLQQKHSRLLEIVSELGKIPVENIDNLEEVITELKELGYVAYLDASTDYLIVEKEED